MAWWFLTIPSQQELARFIHRVVSRNTGSNIVEYSEFLFTGTSKAGPLLFGTPAYSITLLYIIELEVRTGICFSLGLLRWEVMKYLPGPFEIHSCEINSDLLGPGKSATS